MDQLHLKKVGLKVTSQRIQVLDVLTQLPQRHLSAEDIYQHLHAHGQEASLTTIYRILSQFEAAGMVIRHNFEGGVSVFELNEGEHHDHLICTQCQKVMEFQCEAIERLQEEMAAAQGFQISNHCLNIYGLCSDCQAD